MPSPTKRKSQSRQAAQKSSQDRTDNPTLQYIPGPGQFGFEDDWFVPASAETSQTQSSSSLLRNDDSEEDLMFDLSVVSHDFEEEADSSSSDGEISIPLESSNFLQQIPILRPFHSLGQSQRYQRTKSADRFIRENLASLLKNISAYLDPGTSSPSSSST